MRPWQFHHDHPVRATAAVMVVVADGRSKKSTCFWLSFSPIAPTPLGFNIEPLIGNKYGGKTGSDFLCEKFCRVESKPHSIHQLSLALAKAVLLDAISRVGL